MNNLLTNGITTVATYPDNKNTKRTLAVFPDLGAKLVEKNYLVTNIWWQKTVRTFNVRTG